MSCYINGLFSINEWSSHTGDKVIEKSRDIDWKTISTTHIGVIRFINDRN